LFFLRGVTPLRLGCPEQAEGAGQAPARPGGLALWLPQLSEPMSEEPCGIKRIAQMSQRHPAGRRLPGLRPSYTHAPLRITGTTSPDWLMPSMSILSEPIIQSMWIALALPPRRATSSFSIVSPPWKQVA